MQVHIVRFKCSSRVYIVTPFELCDDSIYLITHIKIDENKWCKFPGGCHRDSFVIKETYDSMEQLMANYFEDFL